MHISITLFIYLTVDIHLWLIAHFQFNAITNIIPVDYLMDTIGGRTPFLRTLCVSGPHGKMERKQSAVFYSQQKVVQEHEAAPGVGRGQAC